MWRSASTGTPASGLFLNQLTNAAFLEEPLFRGFLWGYLRMAGWKDVWIWLLQAVLFALGHSYYFGRAFPELRD